MGPRDLAFGGETRPVEARAGNKAKLAGHNSPAKQLSEVESKPPSSDHVPRATRVRTLRSLLWGEIGRHLSGGHFPPERILANIDYVENLILAICDIC